MLLTGLAYAGLTRSLDSGAVALSVQCCLIMYPIITINDLLRCDKELLKLGKMHVCHVPTPNFTSSRAMDARGMIID